MNNEQFKYAVCRIVAKNQHVILTKHEYRLNFFLKTAKFCGFQAYFFIPKR